MKFWLGIPLVWALDPIRARVYLGLGGVSGSGGIWDKLGAWFIRVGGEEWVL